MENINEWYHYGVITTGVIGAIIGFVYILGDLDEDAVAAAIQSPLGLFLGGGVGTLAGLFWPIVFVMLLGYCIRKLIEKYK